MKIEIPANMKVVHELHGDLNSILDDMAVAGKELDTIRVQLKEHVKQCNFNDAFYELCRKQTELTQHYLELSAKRRELTNKIYVNERIEQNWDIPF